MLGYELIQLLNSNNSQSVQALYHHSPRRKPGEQTAGLIRLGLVHVLSHVSLRSWWNSKRKNFVPPDCQPVANAVIELWHADAQGRYDNQGYRMRGHQLTDAMGRFSFE